MVASIECTRTSFSKCWQFKKGGCPSSSILYDSAVLVFLEALEAPDFIDLLLLEALDTLLRPATDLFTLFPALDFLVYAFEPLLNLDDFDFPVFLVFLSSSLSSLVSSSSSSQPGSMSIKMSTARSNWSSTSYELYFFLYIHSAYSMRTSTTSTLSSFLRISMALL